MSKSSEAFMAGYTAAVLGAPRQCPNPWNVQWLREWMRGYDEATELLESDNVLRT